MDQLKKKIRHVPDFPKPGILFYDITTLLRDPAGFKASIDAMTAPYAGKGIDADDRIDAFSRIWRRQRVNRRLEAGRILQQRRDVVEQNAGLREIRYVTNFLLELIHKLFDMKASVVGGHWKRVVHRHAVHARRRWTQPQRALEPFDRVRIPRRRRLDLPAIEISHPAGERLEMRDRLHEVAEADALNPTADYIAPHYTHDDRMKAGMIPSVSA